MIVNCMAKSWVSKPGKKKYLPTCTLIKITPKKMATGINSPIFCLPNRQGRHVFIFKSLKRPELKYGYGTLHKLNNYFIIRNQYLKPK